MEEGVKEGRKEGREIAECSNGGNLNLRWVMEDK
jgi:hypothetical protein